MTYDEEARPDRFVAASGATATARRPATRVREAAQRDAAFEPPNGYSATVAAMALRGLLAPRKTLPPSLFYDEAGCRLFYEITKLPQYYLTRTEFSLLETIAPEVVAMLPAGATLVEYGASDETKAAMLFRATPPGETRQTFTGYIPIDVAAPELRAMRERLAARWPLLTVRPLVADFMRAIELPGHGPASVTMGFFPGSTIGNLEPAAAVGFLRRARDTLGQGARLLLGFDTCRDPARLLPAYDDPAGVTAAFNRNLLVRLNREAGADFDPESFAHRAVWNATESRIEMHLVSRAATTVTLAGQKIRFNQDESIHTENSYKYTPARMRGMTSAAGWKVKKIWADSNDLFAIWLLD